MHKNLKNIEYKERLLKNETLFAIWISLTPREFSVVIPRNYYARVEISPSAKKHPETKFLKQEEESSKLITFAYGYISRENHKYHFTISHKCFLRLCHLYYFVMKQTILHDEAVRNEGEREEFHILTNITTVGSIFILIRLFFLQRLIIEDETLKTNEIFA